jgi:hypothetical protein
MSAAAPGEQICTGCGHVGWQEYPGCGQVLAVVFLSLLGLLPGLIYIALLVSWYPRCASCKNKGGLVPADSPIGRQTMERFAAPTSDTDGSTEHKPSPS